MPGLKTDNAQIGQSGTASQNFNLRAALDGTLRLERGNAGAPISEPIKIESNNDITLAGNLLSGVFGAGQTFSDLVGSRSFGTTYTNTTGKAIFLCLFASSTSIAGMTCIVGGVSVSGQTSVAGSGFTLSIPIPAGSTYNVTLPVGTLSNIHWWELR